MSSNDPRELEVLILAPTGRDAKLTFELLEGEGIPARICKDVPELSAAIESGGAVALVTEEAINEAAVAELGARLAAQPAWSDFPMVIFSGAGRALRRPEVDQLRALGNITFLDRPVQVRTMIAAVRVALRARMRQYDAREAIEARDRFLAMLGHELRNPLAAIRLAVQLLERNVDEAAESRQKAVIDRQSRHLSKLVDDLLDVARITHGKLAIQAIDVDLAEVLHSVSQSFDAHTTSHTIAVAAESPLEVRGDRLRLEQIFGNLVNNALKYTPAGGHVRIVARKDAEHVIVEVIDDGTGIERDLLPRIFDLFAQGEQTIDRARGGMGVGLTVVRSLVKLHGGEVAAESEGPGKGSVFRVTLPRSKVTTIERSSEPMATSARRVVLVEDNEDVRLMLADLLRLSGHDVSSASDGPTGVVEIVEREPDIAFVDIGLPGFDGYELARRVRSRTSMRKVRLVALTGYGQLDDRRRASEAGFDAHLTKPVGLDDLERAFVDQKG